MYVKRAVDKSYQERTIDHKPYMFVMPILLFSTAATCALIEFAAQFFPMNRNNERDFLLISAIILAVPSLVLLLINNLSIETVEVEERGQEVLRKVLRLKPISDVLQAMLLIALAVGILFIASYATSFHD